MKHPCLVWFEFEFTFFVLRIQVLEEHCKYQHAVSRVGKGGFCGLKLLIFGPNAHFLGFRIVLWTVTFICFGNSAPEQV